MSGRVLFERGIDNNMSWDDDALIAAWNRQSDHTASANLATQREELDVRRKDDSTSCTSQSKRGPMPPIPDFCDDKTKKMLEAWYWAGYWTGVAATRS